MKKINDSIKWFRSSILAEYVPFLLVVALLIGAFYSTTQSVSDKKDNLATERKSGDYVPIPSIGMSESYAEYEKTFEIYKSDFGFSFKYPPHLKVFEFCDSTCWIALSVKNESERDESGKIIVSVAENDEQMTSEEWLLCPFSGYSQSKDDYGNYYKIHIDGQEAVYTDGGMWVVVNTPDSRYRLSIADLTTDDASPLFSEMGAVIESLKFLSPAENSDNFLPITSREIIEWEGQVHSYMTYGRRVFKNLDESSNYKYFIVEPHDYTKDGADKYSPTTRSLRGNERVKIVGAIAHYCWWNEEEYDGCVPWVDAENMEVTNRDE